MFPRISFFPPRSSRLNRVSGWRGNKPEQHVARGRVVNRPVWGKGVMLQQQGRGKNFWGETTAQARNMLRFEPALSAQEVWRLRVGYSFNKGMCSPHTPVCWAGAQTPGRCSSVPNRHPRTLPLSQMILFNVLRINHLLFIKIKTLLNRFLPWNYHLFYESNKNQL